MSEKKSYSEKLIDPRWQKKRLEILNRDHFRCRHCQDEKNTLHVHHLKYSKGKEPWEYDDRFLLTICEACHKNEHDLRQYAESDLINALKFGGFSVPDLENLATIAEYNDDCDIIRYLLEKVGLVCGLNKENCTDLADYALTVFEKEITKASEVRKNALD